MKTDKEKSKLSEVLKIATAQLEVSPEGALRTSVSNGRTQYYQLINGTKKYIRNDNFQLAKDLAQKKYNQEVIKVIEKQLKILNKVDKYYDPKALENIPINDLITPFAVNDDEYAVRWAEEKYQRNTESPGTFTTSKGDKVRSKSEVIIADRLFYSGIPYRYEEMLKVGNKWFCPDFTILNKRTRQVYILEHFGMMNNPQYATKAIEKINTYASANYIIGSNFLCTFETSDCPLDTSTINQLIKCFLK